MIEYKVKVLSNGAKVWFLNGKCHREDGPAIEYPDGTKEWYVRGKLHREDGPAIEDTDGINLWYLNDKRVTEAEVMNPKKTIAIDGKDIQISKESFEELKKQLIGE